MKIRLEFLKFGLTIQDQLTNQRKAEKHQKSKKKVKKIEKEEKKYTPPVKNEEAVPKIFEEPLEKKLIKPKKQKKAENK